MKKLTTLLVLTIMIITLSACGINASAASEVMVADAVVEVDSPEAEMVTSTSEPAGTPEVDYEPEDLDSSLADADGSTFIQLNGDSATVDGPEVGLDGIQAATDLPAHEGVPVGVDFLSRFAERRKLRGLHRWERQRQPWDGLYTDGTYTPGTQAASFTITSITTGGGGGMFPGGMTGGPGGDRLQRP